MPLADGEVIAGYTILRSLGAGGMGEVYLAQHPRLPRRDALKVLSASVCVGKRVSRSGSTGRPTSRPRCGTRTSSRCTTAASVDGQLWISMDYVEGTDAGRLLA